MNLSIEISLDIIRHLQKKKEMSIDNIANFMSTTSDSIQAVINKKSTLTSNNIDSYLKSQNQKFWEFALEAIPMNHLQPKSTKSILDCKKLSDHIKKVKKNIKKT